MFIHKGLCLVCKGTLCLYVHKDLCLVIKGTLCFYIKVYV